jgi:hypothetical protein
MELERASKSPTNQQIRKEGRLLHPKNYVKRKLQKISQKFIDKYIHSFLYGGNKDLLAVTVERKST